MSSLDSNDDHTPAETKQELAGTREQTTQPARGDGHATIHIRLILQRIPDAIAPRTATTEPVGASYSHIFGG